MTKRSLFERKNLCDIDASKLKTDWALVKINGDRYQKLPNGNIINWDTGILGQMDKIGSCYNEWIHHPKMGGARMMEYNFTESFTYTQWWVVPVLYYPWSLLELYKSFNDINKSNIFNFLNDISYIYSCILCILLFILGIISWTIFEYFAHKYPFHWQPKNIKWNGLHFMMHGVHHVTPVDPYRLVFPPIISVTCAMIIRYLFYYILFPIGMNSCITGGFMFGYASYETVHYLSHHCPFGYYLKERFRIHSAHHFNKAKQGKLYGVTSQIWDLTFNTL
mmetsp:Transcript_92736/g.113580  ORF Transcript_92736/g.113580 Transcript_92736/m.113580 type:complete len:278 (-) Transcript_92736:155-988(-)